MKTSLIVGLLVIGLGGNAFSMGHPHNLFTAHKHLRAKTTICLVKAKSVAVSNWQPTVELTKPSFYDRFLIALTLLLPLRSH